MDKKLEEARPASFSYILTFTSYRASAHAFVVSFENSQLWIRQIRLNNCENDWREFLLNFLKLFDQ